MPATANLGEAQHARNNAETHRIVQKYDARWAAEINMRLATGDLNNNQNELPALIDVMRLRQTKAKAQVEAALKQASGEAQVHYSFDCSADYKPVKFFWPSTWPASVEKSGGEYLAKCMCIIEAPLYISFRSNANQASALRRSSSRVTSRSVELERDDIQEDEHEGMQGEKEDEALQMNAKRRFTSAAVAPTPKPKRRKAGDPLAGWAIELVPGDKTTAIAPREAQRQLPFLPLEIIMKIHPMCRDLALDELKSHTYIQAPLRISQVYQRLARTNALQSSPRSDGSPGAALVRFPSKSALASFPSAPNRAIDFLLVHASRIRDLSLQLPTPQFLRINPGSFSALEKIMLDAVPRCNWDVDREMLGMTRAELFAEEMPYAEPGPGILWGGPYSVPPLLYFKTTQSCGSLTDINIESVVMGSLIHLLELIVKAHRLSFCTGLSQGAIMPLLRAVRLPIHRLTWYGYLVDDTSIFAPLILPKLGLFGYA
ncbi:hypothetical protein B0H13DRAFT_2366218 [Mycena leptocephala]|nr:hypothetical protein B0H13DRAFT_2366218 [Mycena leptocephala]